MPPIVQEVLHSPGQPRDAQTRAFMEPRFGHDFSRVQVHTGAHAAESASAVNALAYTAGRDVVFGAGQNAPQSLTGKRLLAHELTHVVQPRTSTLQAGHDFSKVRVQADERAAEIQQLPTLWNTATLFKPPRGSGRLQRHTVATENRTGMPDKLRAGLEQLSGIDLSSVRVHYNSSKPAQVDAFAYTEGKDIQLGPGQERHLSHEGWHVVQQMQGRVKPTIQAKGILINDDGELEREADVMGTKAGVLGEQAGAGDFQASMATADGTVLEDEPFVVGTSAGVSQRTSTSQAGITQRAASFAAGTITNNKNIAAGVIAGDFAMGFTPPTLNTNTIGSVADAQAAIQAPTLGAQANPDGTAGASVATVPTNTASFAMELPSSGPWTTVTSKAKVATFFSGRKLAAQAGCSGADDSNFSLKGQPTDADFAANVKTHEEIHHADHERAFNSVIVPWDTKLEAAKTAASGFNGPTQAKAEAALYAAMGGTPNQIAEKQFNEWIRLNNITHRGKTLATGATATPSNSMADPTCANSSADVT